MTDGADLLAAILAEPDEDLHRLKYADWLQEHGDGERAEFIRVGCEAERYGCTFAQTKEQPGWKHHCGTDDRGYWLCTNPRIREQELWDAHARKWFPLLDTFKMGRTQRGFVVSLICTAADWLTHADAILAAHPVRRVKLTTVPSFGYLESGRHQLAGREKSHWIPRGEPHDHSARGIASTLCEMEWPGITFELPP